MENEERINEYIKQCCSNCKNKSNCKIKVFETEDIIYTKCENYQQEKKLEGYKRPNGGKEIRNMKWTKQKAEEYIKKCKEKGLKYWSAKDYLKNHKTMTSII